MDTILLVAAGVLVVGACALGMLYLAGLRAKSLFEANLDTCHSRLRATDRHLAGIQAGSERFPLDLPAPYAAARHDLDAALATASGGAAALHARWRALLHDAGQPMSDTRLPGTRSILLLFYEPRRWRRLDVAAAGLEEALANLEVSMASAAAALDHLEQVPGRIASACARLESTARQALAMGQDLAARGAHGTALERATDAARDLAGGLATVSTATPDDTAAAFERFEALSVPVAEVHARLSGWVADALRLNQGLDDCRAALDDAHRRLAALPPAVDGSDLSRRVDALEGTLRAVEQAAARADVRDLGSLALRARELGDAAGTLADDADGATHRQIEFAAHYRRARTLLARAETEMHALSAETVYPLDWREWAGRCSAAQRTLALIGDPATARTPEALEVDGALAARLSAQAARLIETVAEARTQRGALRQLLQAPALAPDRPWEARAVALHDAANAYAPDNWPTADRVPQLRDDVAALADLHARWVPREPWLPLPVDTLAERLDALGEVTEGLHALEPALARTEEALAALRAAEAQAHEALSGCCAELRQLVEDLECATPAYDRPVTRHVGGLREMIQHGQALEDAFARQARGTIAGKVQRADRWARLVQARIKPLSRTLDASAGAVRTALAGDLASLQNGLRLDAEPAVRDAVALLATPAPRGQRVRGDRLARASAAVAHARALTADRAATIAAADALSSGARNLSQRLDAWHGARDEADAALQRLDACSQTLAKEWPPLSCDGGRPGRLREAARRAYADAQRDETRRVAGARRISEAVPRLAALEDAYRRAAAAATDAEAAARQAHSRVQAAVAALDAARLHTPDPRIDAELERLRRHWQRRPPAEDEAIRELDHLRRKLGAH